MIQPLDVAVIVAYITLIFWLALSVSKRFKNNGEFSATDKYLAGRSLSLTESLCSIIATEVSALTFLGIPAFAFNKDFSFVQIYIGAILGRYIIAKLFLPKVYGQGLTLYEVITANKGTSSGRRLLAIFYGISKIFSVGVRLFSGAILVSHFFNLNMYLGLALVTGMTFLYTLIGGLKAVVRTDVLQMGVFILGGIVAHYMIPQTANASWFELMRMAAAQGKTAIFNWSNPWSIFIGLMGGVLFDMSTHGVDQDFAQRLTASQSLRKGQLAIFLSSFLSISVGLLFLGIGALLWSYYQMNPYPNTVANADHLFAHFIVEYFPVGVRGLMVAGVLAATMSTLDSTINALCACVYNDIFPNRKKFKPSTYVLIDTIVITSLLFTIAVIASKNDGLLLLGLKIQSWTAGALLAIFMSKKVLERYFDYLLNAKTVIGAYVFGVGAVWLNTSVLKWDWNLNVYLGCGCALLFLLGLSKAQSKN